ncbi:flavin monoamine oxidase family protein [Mycobacterium sp. MS1601]|uniref:flavin monoamine oxidase family protein n=1 Tax=Mycobacterium sp. MS1601 TaxID=1936029 RepID=UPI0026C0D5E6
MRDRVDVVVVGAGFAGLTAARELVRSGHEVLVLEGRDRVGGRTAPGSVAGVPVDLGAAFVGPTQDAVLTLAAELDCPTTPTYNSGANLIRWRGRVRTYNSTIPALSIVSLMDVARIQWQFAQLVRAVPLAQPWTAPRAQSLDDQSLADWLAAVRAMESTRDLLAIMSRVTWGCEPADVSLLHAVRYVKAAGGLARMLDVRNGAQQDHFAAGTHAIAERMAADLGERVQLSATVDAVEYTDTGVSVVSTAGTVSARALVVAVPPQHRGHITFSPALPAGSAQLPRVWPQGALSKAFAAYDTPFWRADGRSGQALSDTGPVFITFDVSASTGPGVLLGFVDSREFDEWDDAQRRDRALDCFAELFGEAARSPVDYVDFRWGSEPFSPGGPTAAVPPGSWTTVGRWLREPVGPIFWAGTETADEWTGFLDGAVRSGLRVAVEVTAMLG